MKYTYAYKTPDGQRHEAAMEAASREEVFAALRQQGIKAIKVVAADGSKANGEVRGVRKRIVALVVVSLLFASVIAVIFSFRAGEHSNIQTFSNSNISLTAPRHQVYGDPAIIQEIETGTIPIARTEVEKFLLAYAIPGRAIPPGTVPIPPGTVPTASPTSAASPGTVPSVPRGRGVLTASDPTASLGTVPTAADLAPTPLSPSDPPEVTAYKQILNGLKAEAKAYLAGGGTWHGFVAELNERQQREIEIYERTKRELESVTDPAIRDERNATLRAMGLRTIPRPKK